MKDLSKNLPLIIAGIFGIFAMKFFKDSSAQIADSLGGHSDIKEDDQKETAERTITDDQSQSYAQQLFQAMVVLSWDGIDQDKFFSVFDNLKNQSDYNSVFNHFGLERYSETGGSEGFPGINNERNLTYWITEEIQGEDKKRFIRDYPFIKIF